MSRKKVILLVICLCMTTFVAHAHDFTVTIGNQKVYFNITSKIDCTACVTYKGTISESKNFHVSGDLEIPAKVKHDDVVYTITSIGPKAFSGATDLTSITLPLTIIEIGDFAFEGCTGLSKVVFPIADVKLGEGVFFKCENLEDVSFGSEWKNLNLSSFRWSQKLKTITIPASVEKIQNMKSIINLSKIEVDPNNAKFSSYEGVLYDKSGKVLYGVPKAYEGTLNVKEGTEKIFKGAFIDCQYITSIDFPKSLKEISFRETSRIPNLTEVTFRADAPIITAYADGQGYFLLQMAAKSIKIYVPKDLVEDYTALLPASAGEYSEDADGTVPYMVPKDSLLKAKNIRSMK